MDHPEFIAYEHFAETFIEEGAQNDDGGTNEGREYFENSTT
jgi:hypothetical protein